MSTYEQKTLELDQELALLLGWTSIQPMNNKFSGYAPNSVAGYEYVPRWTQDDAEAFRLMVEYNVDVNSHTDEDMITAYIEGSVQGYSADLCEFISKESAFRVVIVQAVINKLKGN